MVISASMARVDGAIVPPHNATDGHPARPLRIDDVRLRARL